MGLPVESCLNKSEHAHCPIHGAIVSIIHYFDRNLPEVSLMTRHKTIRVGFMPCLNRFFWSTGQSAIVTGAPVIPTSTTRSSTSDTMNAVLENNKKSNDFVLFILRDMCIIWLKYFDNPFSFLVLSCKVFSASWDLP